MSVLPAARLPEVAARAGPAAARRRLLRRAASIARDLTFSAVDGLVARAGRRRAAPPRPPGRSRLAIILVHGIGDLVIWRAALARIAALYPPERFETTLFCSARALDFAKAFIGADRYVAIDRQRFRLELGYRARIVRETAAAGFAVAIQPSFNRYFLVEDALVRATGARERIGARGTDVFIRGYERKISDRWYTRIVANAPDRMHDLRRSQEFVDGLTTPGDPVRLAPLPSPRGSSVSFGRYVVLAIGASSPLKTWPLDRFEAVAHGLAAATELRVVFSGDGPPAELGKRFARWDERRFIDTVGKTDICELVAILSGADLVVSNDTATAHIALALHRPTIVVSGGGLPARYHPYPPDAIEAEERARLLPLAVTQPMPCFDCGWHCKYAVPAGQAAPCVTAIPAEAVLRAALARLPDAFTPTGPRAERPRPAAWRTPHS